MQLRGQPAVVSIYIKRERGNQSSKFLLDESVKEKMKIRRKEK